MWSIIFIELSEKPFIIDTLTNDIKLNH
jgi:hypothetical protein